MTPKHELVVVEHPGYREYRILDKKTAYSNGPVASDLFACLLIIVLWRQELRSLASAMGLVFITYFVRFKVFGILYESLVILPPHGLQLETHRGFFTRPLLSSYRFIPCASLSSAVINEALSGWNVRFYLAIIKNNTSNPPVEVAFKSFLPRHDILIQAFEGLHDILLEPKLRLMSSGASRN